MKLLKFLIVAASFHLLSGSLVLGETPQKSPLLPPSRTFREALTLAPPRTPPGHLLRFTQDGSDPVKTSPLFQEEIVIHASTQIRAAYFVNEQKASTPSVMTSYLKHPESSSPFQSNLPVLLLKSWKGKRASQARYQDVFCALIEPDAQGRSSLRHPFSFSTRAGLKVRGSSTAHHPKPSLNLELRNEEAQDEAFSLLGLPADSDWVLRANYGMDRALIRDALIFKISRKLGHYAPRTRFVEVFLDRDNNGLRFPEDYLGVYTLTEKIKRGPERVRIHGLKKDGVAGEALTGGYLFKDDRADPGDRGLTLPGLGTYYLVDPKEKDLLPAQSRYLRNTLNDFTMAVKNPRGIHPISKKSYHAYIDLRSWLVWHWLNLLAGNLDTYKASAYFYKNHLSRNEGRIEAGPLWDFDRSLNSFDERDNNPFGWLANGDGGTPYSDSRAPWWGWLLRHQEAKQAHIDLWGEMRSGVLRWDSLEKMINEMAYELQGGGIEQEGCGHSPVARNFARWMQVAPRGGSHENEIKILKDWLKLRLQWIDSQFTATPSASCVSGRIHAGTPITLKAQAGERISYTLDGSDPLHATNSINVQEEVTIVLNQSTVVKARAQLGVGGSGWSGILRRVYLIGPPSKKEKLELTEIAWDPEESVNDGVFKAHEFEYFTLKNPSTHEVIDLTGARFTKGIRFNFDSSAIKTLNPGEHLHLVYDAEAFAQRHGEERAARIAGEFKNSRLNNGGETLKLMNGVGELLWKKKGTERQKK